MKLLGEVDGISAATGEGTEHIVRYGGGLFSLSVVAQISIMTVASEGVVGEVGDDNLWYGKEGKPKRTW